MADQMNINFKTNLTTHRRSRLATFFKNELFKKSPTAKKSHFIDEKYIQERRMKRKEFERKRARRNKKKRIRWDRKKGRKKNAE